MTTLRARLDRSGDQSGFTLVELLIAMSLAVVLMAVTMSANQMTFRSGSDATAMRPSAVMSSVPPLIAGCAFSG